MGVLPNAGGIGHALALTSFHWVDQNMDNIIQMSEGATIDFIDPANPANDTIKSIWQDGAGTLETNCRGGSNVALTAIQCPVPMPGAFTVAAVGGLVAASRRR